MWSSKDKYQPCTDEICIHSLNTYHPSHKLWGTVDVYQLASLCLWHFSTDLIWSNKRFSLHIQLHMDCIWLYPKTKKHSPVSDTPLIKTIPSIFQRW